MKTTYKFLAVFSLIALLSATFATPALAFDGRSGETIVIEADETIEDDVYVTANSFVLEGTIKGDLVVFGTNITINGTVEGDLIAAGQSIGVYGTVTDDARIAGAVLQVGESASIGGDLVAAGASLETKEDSVVGGDLVVGAAQALIQGNVADDMFAGVGAMELHGEIGGNVQAEVGNPEESGPSPSMFMPDTEISFPQVKPGFTIAEGAKIHGNLEYTLSRDIKIPEGAVDGKVTRKEPVVTPHAVEVKLTPAQIATNWVFDLLRTIVTLVLFGLLLGWLAPSFMKGIMEKVQSAPAASIGWGVVSYAGFFFALLVVFVAVIIGAVLFGTLTLGGISGTIVWVGILAIFALIVGFVLVTAYLTKIVVAWLGGKLILARFNPALAEHKIWPLLLGVIIVAPLIALPVFGWLLGLLIMLLGLGALWLWGRESMQARKTANIQQ
ncbi:MAG: hypothetical protein HYZ23_04445 [Chloroflexi bacterium]|nr:hypothetical protein [Chloroflexota bacterium]